MADDRRENAASSTVFFERCYVYRSGNGLFALLVLTLFGVGALWVSTTRINNPPGQIEIIVTSVFLLAGFGLLGCSIFMLYSMLIDRRTAVRITVEGIWKDQKYIPWTEVGGFYGTRYSNGISLGFTLRHKRIQNEKSLCTTPLLTEKEYSDLAGTLRDYVQRINCGANIELHPRVPTGD